MNISDQIKANGFAYVRHMAPEAETSSLLSVIGEAFAINNPEPVHQLIPKDFSDAPPNTYSGNYGYGAFPMHTDLAHWHVPPRYFMLRCVVGDPLVTTKLIDGFSLLSQVESSTLSRALVRSRRPVEGRVQMLRLLENFGHDTQLLRWDEKFIKPASDAGKIGYDKLKQLIYQAEANSFCLKERGDTLIIDNWRMIHGRSTVIDTESPRVVDRVYLRSIN